MSIFSSSRKIHSPQEWRRAVGAKRQSYSRSTPNFNSYKPKKKIRGWKIFIKLFKFGVVLLILGWLGGTIMIAWASRDLPNPDKLIDRSVAQSTKIFDRTGKNLLYEIYNEKKRTLIELVDIPEYAKWAVISIEDKNFYSHTGVAWTSIIRAGVSNILGLKSGGGGASTLTQQLVKNAILTNEKTLTRKIKEAILAKQMERKYSKNQILKLYFNEIPYGSSNYGIEAASQSYFGKSAKDLSLAEAATLAALPQAPTKYLNNLKSLKGRRDYILDKMIEYKYIAEEEAETAKQETIKINKKSAPMVAPHFVLYIKELLVEKYGEKAVEQGGLKVITTLDFDKQKMAEEEITKAMDNLEKKYKATNAALTAIDPKTGQILVMVGSHDFFNDEHDGQVNVVLRPRQPGSSFKPIVYAAAFLKGLTPDTKVYDVNTVFKTEIKDYEPHNYDGKEHGIVSLRQALAGSLNIPAVKTLYLTGIDNVINLAEQMGYSTLKDRSRFGLSLVLGGAEVKLLEHVNAFAIFAREGTTVPVTNILKIEDAKGNVLEEWKESESVEVIPSNIARQVTNVLSDNDSRTFIFGANNPLTLPDRPVAAKTGTTNDWRDAWTLGFTPSLVTGVWVGNNDNTEMSKKADGSYVAAPIWQAFMKRALADTPIENFNPPDQYQSDIKPILIGQGIGEILLPINKINGKIATSSTPPDLIEQKSFPQDHTILYYLNKDDIAGAEPTDQNQDLQFANWEAAVQKWAEKNNRQQEIPLELDLPMDSASQPKINLLAPSPNQTLDKRQLTALVQITAPNQIQKVIYWLDDQILETVSNAPYNLATYLLETPKGYHTLKARAIDVNGNYNEAKADFNLIAEMDPPNISFASPKNNSVLLASHFPVSITVKFFQKEKIKKAVIALSKNNEPTQEFATINEPTDTSTVLSWPKISGVGTYTFTSIITNTDDQTYIGGSVTITVE
ncbi:MAG: PBP1A family penicillin-binding protein [Candidatus Magasanikbacteria bacterium]|nr:PBP1A family penicillin-binding protein [Candidatus Magasanikbacteria bacterium]